MPDTHRTNQTDFAPTTKNESSEPKKCSPWVLLALPVGAGLCLSVIVSLLKWLQEENTRLLFLGLDGMRFPIVVGLVSVVGCGIAILYVRPRFKTLVFASLSLLLVGYVGSRVVRIESYYGNRIPRLTWRWTPTAEQQTKTYLTSVTPTRLKPTLRDVFKPSSRDFPSFLGSHRNAKVEAIDLASDWNQQRPKLLWRHPVGLGWASFAVVGNAAVNLEQRDSLECVVCYDVRTGEELWCHSETVRFTNDHGDGPRSTPTIRDGRVLSMGAAGLLTCVELECGELIWKRAVLNETTDPNLMFGMSGSPLVFDDQVLVTPGAGSGCSAVTFSLSTGEETWRSGSDPAAYSSPMETMFCGERQLLSFNGAGLRAYDTNGNSLWLYPWITQGESRVNVAQPVVVQSTDSSARVLISSGYDNGTAYIEITRHGNQWTSETVWTSKQLKSKLSNFVVHDGYMYGLDNGLLTCIGLSDGNRRWKRGRYGHGQMLLVHDKLLIQTETGEVVLVAANPESHQELARFEALTSKTWNHPALAGNILLVRNDREAAAFALPTN